MPRTPWVLVFLFVVGLIKAEGGANVIDNKSNENKPEIVIIGAGAAGLAAASKLAQHNFPVRILEGEDRIGGRVHSVQFTNDLYLDLGCEALLNSNSSIYELLKDENFYHSYQGRKQFFLKSDQTAVDEGLSKELLEIYYNLISPKMTQYATDDLSMGLHFIHAYNRSVHELYGKEREKFRFAFECLPTFEKMITGDKGSETWYDASIKSDYIEFMEDAMHSNGRGLHTALKRMLSKGPQMDRFTFEKTVTNINYAHENVKIVFSDGTDLTAQHIIFTPSLGVLKKQHKTLFTPKLDDDKVKAIEAFRFGNNFKAFIQFEKQWWKNDDYFTPVWTYADVQMIMFEYENATDFSTHESWLRDFLWMFPQPGVPNVASFMFTGKHTKRIEKLSDEELQDGIMFLLDKFAGNLYKISRPVKIFRENWFLNEHFRGTYTYEAIDSRLFKSKLKLSAMEVLARPIIKSKVPMILFAGEATHSTRYGTLDGAIDTGYREADRLINFYNNKIV